MTLPATSALVDRTSRSARRPPASREGSSRPPRRAFLMQLAILLLPMPRLRLSLLLLALAIPAFRGLAASPVLTVVGPDSSLNLTADEFAALPRSEVKLAEMQGKPEKLYGGVAVRELLARAGVPLGDKFRGPALAMGVLVRCKDGYTVLFSLADFDEAFSHRTILLADREDGEILPPSSAPLRIISPGDRRGARSARQVIAIELVSHAPKS